MSNLHHEQIIKVDWFCNNRSTCGRTNKTVINTADFPSYIPSNILVDCSGCGLVQSIWIGPGHEAVVAQLETAVPEKVVLPEQ